MGNTKNEGPFGLGWSRRNFIGAGTTALATAAMVGISQNSQGQQKGNYPLVSDPGQSNIPLIAENPSTDDPPRTDHGDVGAIWYSFNIAHKRVQHGGWTRQVTQRELPQSKDVAGVNMRLGAGSFRELHWHTAGEWAMMLYGTARITVLNPDGTVFIDDVGKDDLWFFPAGYPHSIQGLGPDGCEFLLVFDEGMFSEEDTFLLSEWVQSIPHDVMEKNFGLGADAIAKLPTEELFIFPAAIPKSLAEDKAAVGGPSVESPVNYAFKMKDMAPTKANAGGEVRIVDSHNFPPSTTIAAGFVTLKPGGLRELHWHPNGSEWQFYIAGKGRMTVFGAPGRGRTQDFSANDVGFVPSMSGHYIENTGDSDLVFLELIRSDKFVDFSLNNWLRHLPPEMVEAHLNLDQSEISKIPNEKLVIMK